MKKTLMVLSTMFILIFGLAAVSTSATYWWGGDLDVLAVEYADSIHRIKVDNGSSVINRWMIISNTVDVKQILAVALTAQANGDQINISIQDAGGGVWKINGIRAVTPAP